ncbi:hypothetical protein BCR34DRAFT_573963 [Clohesyomyces aquaticus]|uniref:NADAR domain-containing protein n=1 Tax=Clohesyomyces aquaticus TaxID=1231657 RepID=A0A1Y1YXS1_9PLEO|nr:hypothetical protein BCR34DRAFT_573963 [Clohesyomyces aquaticus]
MPPKTAGTTRITKRPSTRSTSTSTSRGTANIPVTVASSASNPVSADSEPVYFWRPHDSNGYLGQWYSTPFTYDECTYATAEMWMMVQKARLFSDEEVAQRMLKTTDPKLHKSLGREVRGFSEGVWNENRLRIVEEGSYLKFTVSKDATRLRKMLLDTGDRELVEASPRDRIWGVGFGAKNAGNNRRRWGLNLLGKALMNVRKRLREEEMKERETVEGEQQDKGKSAA